MYWTAEVAAKKDFQPLDSVWKQKYQVAFGESFTYIVNTLLFLCPISFAGSAKVPATDTLELLSTHGPLRICYSVAMLQATF